MAPDVVQVHPENERSSGQQKDVWVYAYSLPYQWMMRALGLKSLQRPGFLRQLHNVYRIVLGFYLLADNIRGLAAFSAVPRGDKWIVYDIVNCVWSIQVCLAVAMLHRKSMVSSFFRNYYIYLSNPRFIHIDTATKQQRFRKLIRGLVGFVIVAEVLCVLSFASYTATASTEIQVKSLEWYVYPVAADAASVGYRCFSVIQMIGISMKFACWMSSTGLFVSVAIVLVFEFNSFNDVLSSEIEKSAHLQPAWIEHLRNQREQLVALVHCADEFGGRFIGIILTTSLPVVCILCYTIINGSLGNQTLPFMVALLLFQLMVVVAVCVCCAILNDKAQESYDILYKVPLLELDETHLHHLNIFLNRLGTTSVGLTASKLFVVDKNAVLAFAGSALTYLLVVIELSR